MKTKIIGIFICTLLIGTIIPVGINATVIYSPLDGGWLEERNGVRILHVSGTNYEMGYQYGFLLKEDMPKTLRMLKTFFEKHGMPYEELVNKWNILKDYIPENYKNELQGLVDSSGLTHEEIGVLNIFHDAVNLINCCGGIAWGKSTKNGELIHLRSGDMDNFLNDSETGTFLSENQVIIIREPVDGHVSMSPVLIGDIGTYGGLNEKGIAVSETTVMTNDTTLHGITASLRMRITLDNADTGWEAINIMDSNRTCGWSLLISDGNIPEGYVLEQTANISIVCLWNTSCESKKPFWSMEDIMRRSNCFISPECAEFELNRNYYDTSGLKGIIYYILGLDRHFIPWTHYRVLSQGYETQWGNLNLSNTMDMLRDVYLGETDIIFNIMMKMYFYQPCHQWVATPKTGDMLISFACEGKLSCENPVHHFNLFELLNSEPP
jgi:hypothetical protein